MSSFATNGNEKLQSFRVHKNENLIVVLRYLSLNGNEKCIVSLRYLSINGNKNCIFRFRYLFLDGIKSGNVVLVTSLCM